MRRKFSILLIALALTVLIVTSGAVKTIINAQNRKAADGRKTKTAEEGTGTITTVFKKDDASQTLQDWFESYSELEEVAFGHQSALQGYDSIYFVAVAEGRLHRGMALDVGDGQILVHLTTNRKANEGELFNEASPFIGLALQTGLTTSTNLACNCVLWARYQVPLLPPGLLTYSGKLAIVNQRFPRVGAVAVIPSPTVPDVGHVAVVRNVAINSDGSLRVTLEEANWSSCKVTWRTDTPEKLKIQGYFDPAYSSGSTSPRLDATNPSSGYAGQKFYTTAKGGGFQAYGVSAIILGGWCDAFAKCVIPNASISNQSSTSVRVPLSLNNPGKYMIYFFNQASGKTSNGKPITVY